MADSTMQELLSRLAGRGGENAATESWAAVEATSPDYDRVKSDAVAQVERERQEKLDQLLGRIARLTGQGSADEATAPSATPSTGDNDDYFPEEPISFRAAGLAESEVESLILKFLLARGDATGREVSDQIKLPFVLIEELLRQMKQEQLVVHRGAAAMNDYQFQLTDLGRERARRYSEHCTYFGAAPVYLPDYIESVQAQSITRQHPTSEHLQHAFDDLLINPKMMARLGPAINSGRGLFLYGAPGNGKTSIAERVTKAFGQFLWIPRAIGVDGEIIRLYDPSNHEEAPLDSKGGLIDNRKIDKRWIRIRRPTIVVGGELTMDNLEVTLNTATGISEAPMQLKSNCGTLVIDDFGRQRMSTDELLNRWIVPLEKRLRLFELGQRQENPGAIRSVDHLFDQLGAEGSGRRRVSAANSLQNRSGRSDGSRIPIALRNDVPEAGIRISCRAGRLRRPTALPGSATAVPLLPTARPAVAGQKLLPVPQSAAGIDQRILRFRRRELFCGHVDFDSAMPLEIVISSLLCAGLPTPHFYGFARCGF